MMTQGKDGASQFESTGPFGDDHLEEVPLSRAPLVNVLCQVRFPNATALSLPSGFERLARALEKDYPSFEEQQEFSIQISAGGVTRTPSTQKTWNFTSGDGRWKLAVSVGFLTLFTSEYRDREEFIGRLVHAWMLLRSEIEIPRVNRVGFRYVNHLSDPAVLGRLADLVRPPFLGADAVPMHEGTELLNSLSQAQFRLPGSDVLVSRWGTLPAGASIDPAMAPVDNKTWVLDIDSAREVLGSGEPAAIADAVTEVANRAYRYFRWVVTDDFLETFGGEK